MKITQKIPRLTEAINFIARHDDAPIEQVEAALNEGRAHIDAELKAANERRAKKTAQETGDRKKQKPSPRKRT